MDMYVDEDGRQLSRAEFRAGKGRGRVRVILMNEDDPVVDQSKAGEADLNVLVKRWMQGEPVPQFEEGRFGDVSRATSFQEMQDILVSARDAFYSMPAWLREKFGNSVATFADFAADPANAAEMVDLGLFPRETPEGGSGGEAPPPSTPSKEVPPTGAVAPDGGSGPPAAP